ncbi:hypothetical protein TH66_00550 [Carbonactinospora thermoautotrophica]|uniref:Tetratricopeptide repeat protein n=4 Tax=Carbonactinospora thermoautotrophica TaxID=1469144 RepID=A0A132N6W1_9ACTN|nr:hypothetical protein TH66_00550 [Carbonactinospora thermoautotrophica]
MAAARRRRLRGCLVAALVFTSALLVTALGFATNLATELVKDQWWAGNRPMMLGVTLVLAFLVAVLAVAQHRLAEGGAQEPPASPALPEPDAEPAGRPVEEWDPFDLGVHRAIEVAGSTGELPEYIPRPHDEELRDLLDRAEPPAEMIVLVGGSSTGKTRTAFEAVRDRLAGWRLVFPRSAAELVELAASGRIAERTVVWLNETQDYLDGAEGERAATALAGLLDQGRRLVVIGTLWPEYWNRFTHQPQEGEPDPHRATRTLLRAACRIDVPEDFTGADRQVRARAERDPRLAEAVKLAGPSQRIIQQLAAGPDLINRYRDADCYARAVLTAAIDARRLGHLSPLAPAFLREAARGYLTGTELAEAGPDWFTQALAYATVKVRGAQAPLAPTGTRPGRTDGFLLADYLDQHGRTARRAARIPDTLWNAAAHHVRNPDDLARLGQAAWYRARYRLAVPLLTQAAEAGNGDAAFRLAGLLAEAGRIDEAIERFTRLAEAGNPHAASRLADLLAGVGRTEEAIERLTPLAEAGSGDAAYFLADLLAGVGRTEEAIERLTPRVEAGDPIAASCLADLLAEAGRIDEAIERFTRLAEAGNLHAASCLADLLAGVGRIEEAIEWFARVAEAGNLIAAFRLAGLLAEAGPIDEAIERFTRLAEAGNLHAASCLADLLAGVGRIEEAIEWFARVAEAGNLIAASCLADLLAGVGRIEEAIEWFTRAAEAGDPRAARSLADLLAGVGRIEEAIEWFTRAAEAGSPLAAYRLADLLTKAGRTEEANRLRMFGLNADGSISDPW